jgi:cell division protein FtsL
MATRIHAHPTPARERAAPRSEGQQLSLPSLVIICLVVIGLAALLPLLLSSTLVTTNSEIRDLERVRNDWEARMQELQAEVAALGSLDRIETEARGRLGMVPPSETVYIVVDQPSPEPQLVPSRFMPPEKEQTHHDDSWWETILGILPLP